MTKTVDYYFTPTSPWTYLGHARLVDMAQRHGAAVGAERAAQQLAAAVGAGGHGAPGEPRLDVGGQRAGVGVALRTFLRERLLADGGEVPGRERLDGQHG